MTSQRKPIWKILCSKSESEVTKAKSIFEKIKIRRIEAASRKLKLQNMAHEYTQKLNDVLKKAHTKHEASNYRQFMVQLQKLLVFADSDLKQIDLELGVARKNLVNAENENMKSQKLLARHSSKISAHKAKSDSKESESLNIIQYNINS
ncbi:hypothetical protein OA528_03965 [Gammaproteobacteria bacterium]|nr:hypothetical protein [Gammaproteobacteria bacterium]